MKNYKHITQEEREKIYKYIIEKRSYRWIGRKLDRDHKAISYEVKIGGGRERYSPSKAQAAASERRSNSKKGSKKLDQIWLREWVVRRLGEGWSPEQISGRLKKKAGIELSYESIYRFIYAKENKRLKLWEFLRRKHQKRKLKYGRKTKKGVIPSRVMISDRPKEINSRKKFSHWETDNMEGPRASKSAVSVSVERKTRFTKLTKMNNKTANAKTQSLLDQFQRLPSHICQSITFDNGLENYQHQEIAKRLNCDTYFCNPYHSWEKGSVENAIGLVREYLPKGTDLTDISQAELNHIAWHLNNRPRKILNYLTPSEVFTKLSRWVT